MSLDSLVLMALSAGAPLPPVEFDHVPVSHPEASYFKMPPNSELLSGV